MDTKKRFLGLLAFLAITIQAFAYGDMRQEARFLTDKMMYELRLSSNQYLDLYEINYDFLASVAPMRNAIVHGDPYAIDSYYILLDNRNQDISWVLNTSQYRRYSGLSYFYRPIVMQSGTWNLRVYLTYTNRNHYYYGPPTNYRTYNGRYHRRNGNDYYYRDRYNRSSNNRRYRSISSDSRRNQAVRHEDFGYRDQRRKSSSGRNNVRRSDVDTRRSERPQRTTPTYRVNDTRRDGPSTREPRRNSKQKERVSTSSTRSSSRTEQSGTTRRRTNQSSSRSNDLRSGRQVI